MVVNGVNITVYRRSECVAAIIADINGAAAGVTATLSTANHLLPDQRRCRHQRRDRRRGDVGARPTRHYGRHHQRPTNLLTQAGHRRPDLDSSRIGGNAAR